MALALRSNSVRNCQKLLSDLRIQCIQIQGQINQLKSKKRKTTHRTQTTTCLSDRFVYRSFALRSPYTPPCQYDAYHPGFLLRVQILPFPHFLLFIVALLLVLPASEVNADPVGLLHTCLKPRPHPIWKYRTRLVVKKQKKKHKTMCKYVQIFLDQHDFSLL